ncbi:MAG: hypothetical protein M0Q19_10525 [Candidatus Cloacimonetes bacterium]|nr:hypothetical protein [Candidatus Cloacimonadota bacterium]
MKHIITAKVDEDLHTIIEEICKESKKSKNAFFINAIKHYIAIGCKIGIPNLKQPDVKTEVYRSRIEEPGRIDIDVPPKSSMNTGCKGNRDIRFVFSAEQADDFTSISNLGSWAYDQRLLLEDWMIKSKDDPHASRITQAISDSINASDKALEDLFNLTNEQLNDYLMKTYVVRNGNEEVQQ